MNLFGRTFFCKLEAKEASENDISILSDPDATDTLEDSTNECTGPQLIHKVPKLLVSATQRIENNQEISLALYKAAEQGKPDLCEELLSCSFYGQCIANINFKGPDNLTPLHAAVNAGHFHVCQVLLNHAPSIDINSPSLSGLTPLHLSCIKGNIKIAKLLVKHGANIDAVDINLNTPLHLAVKYNQEIMICWLLIKSPDLNLRNLEGKLASDCAEVAVRKIFEQYLPEQPECYIREGVEEIKVKDMTGKVVPNDFETIGTLGKGTFGEVFLVRKRDTGNCYAMKVLSKEKVIGKRLLRYALTERKVLGTLKHPFIVGLKFAFQNSADLFLLLDYCPGGDLRHQLTKALRFPEPRAKIYLCEMILAIEELHRYNIIYRDLKPENILIDAEGHAVLTDFGLSKELLTSESSSKSFCGSPAYLAPEMLNRQAHGKAVDWYSLGVLYYEMLTGEIPGTSVERVNRKSSEWLKTMKGVSYKAQILIAELLEKEPGLRLGSKQGAEEVKNHCYFTEVDWEALMKKRTRHRRFMVRSRTRHEISENVFHRENLSKFNDYIAGWTFVSTTE